MNWYEKSRRKMARQKQLKQRLIKLGQKEPDLRDHLRPILDKVSRKDVDVPFSDDEIVQQWRDGMISDKDHFSPIPEMRNWDLIKEIHQDGYDIKLFHAPRGFIAVGGDGLQQSWAVELEQEGWFF